jgi:hypothetical protein
MTVCDARIVARGTLSILGPRVPLCMVTCPLWFRFGLMVTSMGLILERERPTEGGNLGGPEVLFVGGVWVYLAWQGHNDEAWECAFNGVVFNEG